MKTLDILRHTMRQKPGSHLSPDGIGLARYVGKTLGPYQRIATSALPRAMETAVAMGFAVTETIEELGTIEEGVVRMIGWPNDLAAIGQIAAERPQCAEFAEAQASLWEEIAARVSSRQAGLIITHGAILELGVVACLRRSRQPIVGEPFAYCEGARLHFGDHGCQRVEQHRLPPAMRLVSN